MKRLLITASLALLALASCKKDKDSASTKKPEELLLGDWLTTAITVTQPVDFGNGPTLDGFTDADPCTKDDYLTFKNDGTFEANQGPIKCNSAVPQISYGTYVLSYPYIDFGGLQTATILQLDNATLKFFVIMDTNPGKDTITQTMKRK